MAVRAGTDAATGRRARRRRTGLVGLVLAVTLLGSCTLIENTHYKVSVGTHVYAWFYRHPSWQIAAVYGYACNANIACTADLLEQHTNISGWGAAEFYDGIRDYSTFWLAVQTVWSGGADADTDAGHHCLILKKSIPTGRLAWETQPRSNAQCKLGQPYT